MQFWQFYWSNIVKSEEMELEFKRMIKSKINFHAEEMRIMSIAFHYFYNGIEIMDDF